MFVMTPSGRLGLTSGCGGDGGEGGGGVKSTKCYSSRAPGRKRKYIWEKCLLFTSIDEYSWCN